ncbi:hypothetical protein GQ457_09G029670 [Hibiscus cannabinus]
MPLRCNKRHLRTRLSAFQVLPFHYVEISRLLFDHARDDIPDMYMVRSLIEDIRDVRIHKVETSLEKFSGTSAVKIPNLSAMEVNIIRPFVGRALQAFYKHDNPEKIPDVDRPSSAQTRVANNEPRRPLRRYTNHFQPAYDEGTSVLLETLFGESYLVPFSL